MDIDNVMDMNIDINVDMYIAIEMEIGCAWHVSNVRRWLLSDLAA